MQFSPNANLQYVIYICSIGLGSLASVQLPGSTNAGQKSRVSVKIQLVADLVQHYLLARGGADIQIDKYNQ